MYPAVTEVKNDANGCHCRDAVATTDQATACVPPLQAGHRSFVLFVEGDELYESMLTDIAAARICMENYTFAADEIGWRFARTLAERATAGIEVRLHLNAAGFLLWGNRKLKTWLRCQGIRLRLFHRWRWRDPLRYNRRNHRKLVPRKRDHLLVQWAARAAYAKLLNAGVCEPLAKLVNGDLLPHFGPFPSWNLAPWNHHAVYPIPKMDSKWHCRSSAQRFARGSCVYEYLPRMLHAKTAVVDSIWATVGTANLDYRSLFMNHEINLVSRDLLLCQRLETQFLVDLKEAEQIMGRQWACRPWSQHVVEVIGWLARRGL